MAGWKDSKGQDISYCEVDRVYNDLDLHKDVPELLWDSELYRSLAMEEDETFEVPAKVFRQNLTSNNNEDLDNVLSALRYWMIQPHLYQ